MGFLPSSFAAERTVRLRFAWGGSTESNQRWSGTIRFPGAELSKLQPLGVEADAPVANWIDGESVIIAPLLGRSFDGFDLTVQADEDCTVEMQLQSEQATEPISFSASLRQIVEEELRRALDEPGSFFLSHRCPGDQLRVVSQRNSYVFAPQESWHLEILPDLLAQSSQVPVALKAELVKIGSETVLWQSSREIAPVAEPNQREPLAFEIVCPETEGAYRIRLTARAVEGFATWLLPGQQSRLLASREIEFVVIDPSARIPTIQEKWEPVLSIDSSNPSWWHRLPTWAQVPRLRGKVPGSVGNVKPVVRPAEDGLQLVELPAQQQAPEPYWQAYTLPVQYPGEPHLLEIEYPLSIKQHLSINLVEADAAGRIHSSGPDSGIYTNEMHTSRRGKLGVHRILFWPRTRSPQLLFANLSRDHPAQFGTIRLYRQQPAASLQAAGTNRDNPRLIAGYLSRPALTENFSASEQLDTVSGLSVHGWGTFLEAAERLVQTAKYRGYNSMLLTVSADGSTLFPSDRLRPSPRYDTGVLAATAPDPVRKDVLEVLLRIFDREGLRLVPVLQLATPLPRLEQLQRRNEAHASGIAWVGHQGQLLEQSTPDGQAPYYNLLNEKVQAEIDHMADELLQRCVGHPSFAGIGIQLSSNGYTMLPGPTWGLDDNTFAAFANATEGIKAASLPDDQTRFRKRAELLLGNFRPQWTAWREQQLTKFYANLAATLRSERSDLRLFLTTEDLFASPSLEQQLRRSISSPVPLDDALAARGVDLEKLQKIAGIVPLTAHRISSSADLRKRALNLRLVSAARQGELVPSNSQRATELFYETDRLALPSFDRLNPGGADVSNLKLVHHALPGGSFSREPLMNALATSDSFSLIEGGEFLSLSSGDASREIFQTLAQLPVEASVRTIQRQPIVIRVYRTASETTVAIINQSPWSATLTLPLEAEPGTVWKRLPEDAPIADATASSVGHFSSRQGQWQVELEPYDLQAWRFRSTAVRLGELEVALEETATPELAEKIEQIEARTANLDIHRPYPLLQNPGFEQPDAEGTIPGWQPRQGATGKIEINKQTTRSGNAALRLQSEDSLGVAVQSQPFPTPETGQIVIGAYVRAHHFSSDARLHIVVEDSRSNRYRRYASLGPQTLSDKQWSWFEFPVNDLPLASRGQMHIQFHLTGQADLFVDDVELCDLRFEDARRGAIVKRVFASKIALQQGQVMDCLEMLDEYWTQYLVEYVPPVVSTVPTVAEQPRAEHSKPAEPETAEESFGERIRNFVPSFWR